MKKQIFYYTVLLLISVFIGFSACKSSKVSRTELDLPCHGKDFRSAGQHLFASSTATRKDKESAITYANLRARENLAKSLNSTIRFATEGYNKNFMDNETEDTKKQLRDYAFDYGKAHLSNVYTVCEKIFERSDGKYEFYIALRIDNDTLMQTFKQGLKDAEINLDMDMMNFRKLYEQKLEEDLK